MAKVIWAPSALEDIEKIAEYISRDSPDRASLFIERIIGSTDKLADFPNLGRIIPEIQEDTSRELIYGPYRIMYFIESDEIWITGVVHGAQNWEM